MTNNNLTIPSLPAFSKSEAIRNAERIFDLLDVSAETRQDYKYRIGMFLDFIDNNPLNYNSFLEFKRSLAERNDYSISTKNKYLGAGRIFLKELNRQGILPNDITSNVKSFKTGSKHKRDGLNAEEISKLFEFIGQLPLTQENTRLRAIVALLTLQGLRQCEVTRLDIEDIDLVSKKAMILGKGRDDKELIDLHPETIKALQVYLKTNKIADGALFTSRSNNHKNQRLTTRAVREIIKTALNLLGIEKTVHGFRHFFASTLIKTYKGDLLEVAGYTRHRGLEMLQVYNDEIKRKEDLPRYYNSFRGVSF